MIDLNRLSQLQEMARVVQNSPEYQLTRTLNRMIRIGKASTADHVVLADKAETAMMPVYEKNVSKN